MTVLAAVFLAILLDPIMIIAAVIAVIWAKTPLRLFIFAIAAATIREGLLHLIQLTRDLSSATILTFVLAILAFFTWAYVLKTGWRLISSIRRKHA